VVLVVVMLVVHNPVEDLMQELRDREILGDLDLVQQIPAVLVAVAVVLVVLEVLLLVLEIIPVVLVVLVVNFLQHSKIQCHE
jgi:hypothetical protein